MGRPIAYLLRKVSSAASMFLSFVSYMKPQAEAKTHSINCLPPSLKIVSGSSS